MLYLSVLFTTLVMLVVVTAIGLRVCAWLPRRLQPIGRGYFSPLLGLACFIPLATAVGWAQPFSFAICASITFGLAAWSLWSSRHWKPLLPLLARVVTFGAIASLATMAALVRYDGFNAMNDAFTYLSHAQWLQTHTFRERVLADGFHPVLTQISLYQDHGHRMGASFFLAWVQALFRYEWSYDAYSAAVALPLLAGSLAVGGAVRLIARRGHVVPMLTAAVTATSLNGWVYGSTFGFFPQTFGLAFATGGATLVGASLSARFRPSGTSSGPARGDGRRAAAILPRAKALAPGALLLAAFVFTYNDLLPFVALAMGLLVLAPSVRKSSSLGAVLTGLAIIAVETIVIINIEAFRVLRNFVSTVLGVGSGSVNFGWPVVWSPWEFAALALGLRHPVDGVWLLFGRSMTAVVTAAAVVAIGVTLVRRVRRGSLPPPLVMHVALVALFGGAFLYFRYTMPSANPGEVGRTFIQFKLAKWASLSTFVLLGVFVNDYWRRERWMKAAISAGMVCVVMLGVWQHTVAAETLTADYLRMTGQHRGGLATLLELRRLVQPLPPDDIIYLNLGDETHKLRQMVAYVLPDRKLASNYTDDTYLFGQLPAAERVMPYAPARWVVDYAPPTVRESLQFARAGNLIVRPRPELSARLASATDGYGREADDERWWEWTGKTVTFRYYVLGGPAKGRLRFLYMSAVEGATITVTVSGLSETSFTLPFQGGWNEYVGPEIDIASPTLSVTFTSDKPGKVAGTDPRALSFLIGNLTVESGTITGGSLSTDAKAAPNVRPLDLVELKGGYGTEREGATTWRTWTARDLRFRYRVPDGVKAGRLKFTYQGVKPGLTLTINVGSRSRRSFTVPMKVGWNDYQSEAFPIDEADLTVDLASDGDPVRLGPNDPRMVTYLIQNLEVLPAEAPLTTASGQRR